MARISLCVCLFLVACCLGVPDTIAAGTDACIDCHGDTEFRVKNRKLYDYYQQWIDSAHAKAGASCSDCHGGNPDAAVDDKEAAHQGVLLPSHVASTVYYKALPATCGKCHEEVFSYFVNSTHFQKLQEDANAPHCATCHGSMDSQVYFTSIVDSTCQSCHENSELSDVAAQARDVLQQLTIARAYLGWTTLHYDQRGEAAKSAELNDRYKQVAYAWHRFDLATSEQESAALLRELEAIFKAAWSEENPHKQLP